MKKCIALMVLFTVLTPAYAGGVRFRRPVVQVNAPSVQVNVGRAGLFRRPVVVSNVVVPVQRSVVFRSFGTHYNAVTDVGSNVFVSRNVNVVQRNVGFTGYAAGVSNVLRSPAVVVQQDTTSGSCTAGDAGVLRAPVSRDVSGTCGAVTNVQSAPLAAYDTTVVQRQVSFAPSVVYSEVARFPVVRAVRRVVFAPVRFVGRAFFPRHYR